MGGNITMGRAISPELPPIALTFWRCLVAALIALPFVYPKLRSQLPILVAQWRLVLGFGFFWAVAGHAVTYAGLFTTTAISFWWAGRDSALSLGFMVSQRNMGLMLGATGGALPDLTWVYFALAQFPIYLTPQILKPLMRRMRGVSGESSPPR